MAYGVHTLVQVHSYGTRTNTQLMLMCVDGLKGCAERLDIGEHIYSTPLIDDVTGDGYLDLLVSTMNGQVYYWCTIRLGIDQPNWTNPYLVLYVPNVCSVCCIR